jgi:hypothetical protein
MKVIKWRNMRGMWNVWEMSENKRGKDYLGVIVDAMILKWRSKRNIKQQFVITHTKHQTGLPALLESWVTNTPSVKMLYPQKKNSPHFCKNVTCLYVGVLSNCQVFFLSPVKLSVMGYKKLLDHEQYEGVD